VQLASGIGDVDTDNHEIEGEDGSECDVIAVNVTDDETEGNEALVRRQLATLVISR
jgi:hypothetical protein